MLLGHVAVESLLIRVMTLQCRIHSAIIRSIPVHDSSQEPVGIWMKSRITSDKHPNL
jgi:hypothetical protein